MSTYPNIVRLCAVLIEDFVLVPCDSQLIWTVGRNSTLTEFSRGIFGWKGLITGREVRKLVLHFPAYPGWAVRDVLVFDDVASCIVLVRRPLHVGSAGASHGFYEFSL